MKTVVLAALTVVSCVLPALALEPLYADQVVPAEPQLKLIEGGVGSDELVFVETATMGRVGDTGYVWRATFPGIAGSPPVFTRLVIDCPSVTVQEDWRTSFSTDLRPSGHEQLNATYRADDPVTQAIVDLTCSGRPATPDHHGIAAAMDWFIDEQLKSDNLFAQLDPSLVQIGSGDLPVRTLVFMDENSGEWLIGSGQATIRQLHVHAVPVENGTGTPILGAWVDMTYDCDARPIIYTATTIVQIDAASLHDLPPLPARASVSRAEPGTLAADIADFVCTQVPVPQLEGQPRLDSLEAALDQAKATVVAEPSSPPIDDLYDTQPPPSNLSLVRIAGQTTPYATTLFYDENSVALNLGTAWVWHFVAFSTPFQLTADELIQGLWIQMQYLCIAPSTAHAMGMVPVDTQGRLLPWRPPELDDHDVSDGSREMDIANHSCRQVPIEGRRVTSIDAALREAARQP